MVSTPMVIGWFTAVWILFSASTQRVQDIGWGPWAVAIPVGLAIGTGKIERLFGTRLALDIGNLVGGAMLTVFILIAALKRGQAGANKWGPDPRQDLPQL